MKKHMFSLFLSVLMLPILCSYSPAYEVCTYNGFDIKWSNPSVTYYVNASGGPSGTIAAVTGGMQTWTDITPADFTFVYGGTTSSTAHGTNDGTNIITFGSLSVGTLAENYYWFSGGTARMIDSDIRFNTYYSWSTNGTPSTYDVQNIGTHEHGHSLCLLDLYDLLDSTKTMYGYGYEDETQKRTLHQDDIDGINYLYCGKPAKVVGGSSYHTIQEAYDAAQDGDTLLIQSVVRTEDVFIDLNKEVTIETGYACDFLSNGGESQIQSLEVSDGIMVVSHGVLVVE